MVLVLRAVVSMVSLKGLLREAKRRDAPGSPRHAPSANERTSRGLTTSADLDGENEDHSVERFLVAPDSPDGRARFTTFGDSIAVYRNIVVPSAADALLSFSAAHRSCFVPLRGRQTLRLGGEVSPEGLVKEPLPPLVRRLSAEVGGRFFRPRNLPPPNHCLVNWYPADGTNSGIMPHTDGPLYSPLVCILSLKSAVLFDFWHINTASGTAAAGGGSSMAPNGCAATAAAPSVGSPAEGRREAEVPLGVNSALLFWGEAYGNLQHGIEARRFDEAEPFRGGESLEELGESQFIADQDLVRRGERISLTLRHVPEAVQ